MIDQGYGRLDKLDGLRDENLPRPVLARDVPLWQANTARIVRAQIRVMERQERAARRAERRVGLWALVVLVVVVVAVLAVTR